MFVANVVWQKKYSPGNNQKGISSDIDHILVYTKNKSAWAWNLLPRSEKQDKAYVNRDNDPRGVWKASDLTRSEHRDRDYYPIITPSGKEVWPAKGRSWSRPPDEIERLRADGQLWFGPKGDAKPSLKRFLTDVQTGMVSKALWFRDEVGDNEQAKKEAKVLNEEDIFATPKPERLIERVIQISTNKGDLVVDSFSGSGTTGAVAHKMGRKWIMIELGDHCHTHIVPRLKKVIDGEDQGGISKAVNWQGGGGFRYYRLAPSLLEQDRWGRWVISKDYDAAMLAEAICKLEGFTYAPSDTEWGNHGYSTEQDRIYVTTQTLSVEQLQALSDEVGEDYSVLVCCSAFRCKADRFPNLTLKKIPKMVLSRCEYGHDDYSLNVENLPMQEKPKPDPSQGGLFQDEMFDDNGQG
jgi:adenine-specific DNA-methyltransferase